MSSTGQSSTPSRTMARDKPANWEVRIAALVGKAFGCQFMMQVVRNHRGHRYANNGAYIFIGVAQNAEIASYTASVLTRNCHRARQEWVTQNFAGLGVEVTRGEKTRMGDMFAEGWVLNIEKLVNDFAIPPEVDEAIRQHAEQASKRGVRPTFLYRIDDGLVRVRSVDFGRGTVKSLRAGPCRLDLAAVIQGVDGTRRAVSPEDLPDWAVTKISQAGFEVSSFKVLDYRMRHGNKWDRSTGEHHRISLPVARLALDLAIADPQSALSAWEDGIGRGRRFGLGMLCY